MASIVKLADLRGNVDRVRAASRPAGHLGASHEAVIAKLNEIG